MNKAVIFDFDGVLADTFDVVVGICRDLGIDFTIDEFRDHHDGNVFEKPKLKFSKEHVEGYLNLYQERAKGENLFPLKEELDKLTKKYKLFVISSNIEIGINKYFDLGGWSDLFEKVYGMETEKSKMKKFKMLFKEYKIKKENCIFVTDTLGDLLEGEAVGVKTLAVTWGFHGETRLRKGNPNKIIHDFKDLASTICQL